MLDWFILCFQNDMWQVRRFNANAISNRVILSHSRAIRTRGEFNWIQLYRTSVVYCKLLDTSWQLLEPLHHKLFLTQGTFGRLAIGFELKLSISNDAQWLVAIGWHSSDAIQRWLTTFRFCSKLEQRSPPAAVNSLSIESFESHSKRICKHWIDLERHSIAIGLLDRRRNSACSARVIPVVWRGWTSNSRISFEENAISLLIYSISNRFLVVQQVHFIWNSKILAILVY